MLKVIKRIFKYLFIIIVVLFLALASVPFLFKDKIKATLLNQIDHRINAKVYFSDLSFTSFKNFPHFTVKLHDACVLGIGEFEGDTLISAKGISISFNIYSFLNGSNFEVNGIHLDEPLIYARILPDGMANYNIMKTDSTSVGSSKNASFNLNIDKWEIENGRIVYDDRLQKTYIEVGGLYHRGSGDFKQEISDLDITTKVSDLTLVYNGITYFKRKLFEADLLMEMNLKERKFVFKDHAFRLGDFKFRFKGFFKLLDNGYETDLKFVVKETSFKNLLSLLPGVYQKDMKGIETKGEFSCKGFLKGIYDVKDHKVPTFGLDLKVDDAMFKYSHLPKAVEHISFHLAAQNLDGKAEHSSYDLKVFHFEIDHKPVHGRVFLKGQKDFYIDADVKLKADLAQIEKIYPIDGLVLKGLVNSEIKINGHYNASMKLFPKVDAFLQLEKGYLKSKKNAPLDMDSIHVDAELFNSTGLLADTRISLNKMTFLLDDEPFVMSGTISDMKDYNYNLKIDGLVDLAKLTQLYPLPNTTLSGTLNFDITTDGSLTEIETRQYAQLKTSGTLEIKDMAYQSKGLTEIMHIDDALFTFTPDKIELDRFKAEFGKSNVTLSGHLYNYIPYLLRHDAPINGDLTMTCDTLDLNEWFPNTVSSDSAASAAASTATSAASEVLVIPGNIGFTIDSDIKLVKFGTMDINSLDGEIRIKDGLLTLNETGFNALNSKFVLSGDYDTRNAKHPLFDLKIDVEDLDIQKAYQTFIDPKSVAPATGNFSTVYNLRGELTPGFTPINSTLVGKGKITIDKVSVKGMKLMNHVKRISKKEEFSDPELNDISMDTEIKNGKFLIYPFSFKVSKFLTEVEGEQGFNDSINYLIKISVPPFTKLRIPISIIGTTDKPVIKTGRGFDPTDFERL